MAARSRVLPFGWLVISLVLASCGTGRDAQASGPLRGGLQLAGAAVRTTAVSTVRSPLTSTWLGIGMLVNRAEELIRGNIPFTLSAPPRIDAPPGSTAFSEGLTALGLPAPALGTVELLVDGPEFFPAFEEELRGATESVDLQIYIWDNDDIGVRYADLVRARARRVPVRILLDDLGTTISAMMAPETAAPDGFRAPADIVRYLRRDSSPLRIRRLLTPWAVLDHCKLLVFDRQTALLGGINIGREYYSEWHDLSARVRGPIVNQLQPEFDKKWRLAHPAGDLALLAPATRVPAKCQPVPPGAFPIRLLRTNLLEGRRENLVATLEAIRASRERIWLENQYLTSDRIVDALVTASRRGVDVRVVIPDLPIEKTMDLANHFSARRLLQAGCRVYRYPGMTHMKAMICDGWATMGATNLDTHSLQIIHEINISYSDPAAVADLEARVFHPDFAASKRLTLRDTSNLLGLLVDPLVDQL